MKVVITLSGQETLRNFDRLAAAIRTEVLEHALRAGATPILQRAVELVPVKTGHLRRSLGIKSERAGTGARAEVGTDVDYAPYLEYGTRKMAPRPYLRPGFDSAKDTAVKLIEQEFRAGIAREEGKL